MSRTFDVLEWTVAAARGETYSDFPEHPQITVYDTGVIAIEPELCGPKDVILSCAVHGDETAPIELVRDMIHAVLDGTLKLR
ncbi:MAG TPA: succinylglutamate desuccinylase/aspartoacylase family protein, partial [Pseudidiomarina sp.]|nr:succinylglutamate desuccinylase/aspartoacylase family protein [Pseudidiomarina sp.]